jgi:hypothetical protein
MRKHGCAGRWALSAASFTYTRAFNLLIPALCCAASLIVALLASSPASAQFMCTVTAANSACTNSGTAPAFFNNTVSGVNQNADTTNAGTANGFISLTGGGGNATASNSGSDSAL